jgi:hypothetical protein
MDGCLLNDAFPSGAFGSPGCQDRTSGDESRRQEKKKARRCRGPAATYLNSGMNMVGSVDPDRPSNIPMAAVPALNTKTGLKEHSPVTQEYDYETFVGEMDDLPAIQQTASSSNLEGQTPNSFFGASPNDDNASGGITKNLMNNFMSAKTAPFVDVIGEDESYKLSPDFGTSFDLRGVQKASGNGTANGPSTVYQESSLLSPTKTMPNSILPFPNVDMFWKNNPKTGGQSSFFTHLSPPSGQVQQPQTQEENHGNRREVLEKLDRIFARLDDMDSVKSENAQTEILLFIMTGLGVIFLMDISCRTASALASRR